MSYMVLYTGLDNSTAFERCEELAEAVAEVERLRNEQSIDGAQIYRLEEVKFEIKPYFRVELPEMSAVVSPAASSASIAPSVASSAMSVLAEAAPVNEDAPWTTASAPSMLIAPPPPPPPPAPIAPMAYDGAPTAQDDDAISGSRRGLFGR